MTGADPVTGADPAGGAERLLRSVVNSLEGRLCILTADGTVLDTNRTWDSSVAALGPASGAVGSNFFDLTATLGLAGDDLDRLHRVVRGALTGDRLHPHVKLHWVWAGAAEDVVVRVHAVGDHDQARAVVSIVDISAAMSTERELRRISERAQLLALVAEHTDNSVVIQDAQGRIEWVNDAFCRLTGYTREEVTGRRRQDLWLGGDGYAALAETLTAGRGVDVELPARSTTGRAYWTHLQVQPIVVDGTTRRFVGIERDVTARRDAEERLRTTNAQVRALVDEIAAEKSLLDHVLGSIPHLVYWKDPSGRYAGANQAFLSVRELDGAASVLERTEPELGVRDTLADLLPRLEAEVLADGRPRLDLRVNVISQAGVRRELLLSVLPYGEGAGAGSGVIGVAADVTHASQLERQLAQASRLESIGQLAAGIAHEINTPVQYVSDNTTFVADSVARLLPALREVTAVVGSSGIADVERVERVRLAVADLDLDFMEQEAPAALTESLEGLHRVAEIVKAMKAFAHPGTGRALADLNAAVETTAKVCRNEWKYVARLDLDLDPALGAVPCYEGEFKQVILNLLINAAQAIGEQRQRGRRTELGTIRIATRRGAREVTVTVADDGPGMTEAVAKRVFDPFFTTKDVGQGTGQGLTMAYAIIVGKHGGRLDVESTPDVGTTFTISLPLAAPDEDAAPR